MTFEIGLAVALIPPLILLFFIWKVDKLEHEPVSLILKVMLFGALSCIPAIVLEIGASYVTEPLYYQNMWTYFIVDNFFGVALMEELVKMAVIFLVVWRHKEFNCLFDGIVYGAASSLGFAALENVKYVMGYGIGTGLVRSFTAIPGHFIFGVIMGLFLGLAKCAKYDKKAGKKWLCLLLALALPVFVHGYYDYLLTVAEYAPLAESIWWVYLVAMYIVGIVIIIVAGKKDRRINMDLGYSGEPLAAGTTSPMAAAVASTVDGIFGSAPVAIPVAKPVNPTDAVTRVDYFSK